MKAARFLAVGGDEGSAFLAAAIATFVISALGFAVIEGAQWFQHRRYLQMRVDAAALAGGQAFRDCFDPSVSSPDSVIEAEAIKYSGFTEADYNTGWQRGRSSPDGLGLQFPDGQWPNADGTIQTGSLGSECEKLLLDVTLAQGPPELGLAYLGPISPPIIHARARVALQEIQSLIPDMPLAIPDVRPKEVAVTFVNNATGAALSGCPNGCVFQLSGPTQSGQLNDWGANITIPATALATANMNVGMRVGIGSQVASCANTNGTSTYRCYDYNGPGGIIDLRTYDPTAAGSQSIPMLRAVTPSTCSGTPFFSIYQAAADGTCETSITATVDFGGGGPPAGAQIQATFDNQTVPLTNNPAGSNTWASNVVSLPLEGGPYPVEMSWCTSGCSKSNNFTNFNSGHPVQQIFSGSDGSSSILPGGPIFAASVLDSTTGDTSYSLSTKQNATLAVTVGLTGGVHLPTRCDNGTSGGSYTCATDPPVLLRFTTGSGNDSQTYAIDCGGGNLRDQIENGCTDAYSINDADVCPDPANPTPTDCAPVQTGAATGQVQQGMNARFAPNNVCYPNNYPAPPLGDPREVTLVITDFSAFSGAGGSGASDVPVVTFAKFYVTGWDGSPNTSSCSSNNEPAPSADTTNGQGSNIWGHFIKDVDNEGNPSGKACDPTGIAPCVPALVR